MLTTVAMRRRHAVAIDRKCATCAAHDTNLTFLHMKSFDLHRFLNMMRLDIAQRIKTYRSLLLGAFVGLSFVCIGCLSDRFMYPDARQFYRFTLSEMLQVAFWLIVMVCASLPFQDLAIKQQRMNFMMLPASQMEKYVGRLLQTLVLLPLCMVVVLAFVDTLQCVVMWLRGVPTGWVTLDVLRGMLPSLSIGQEARIMCGEVADTCPAWLAYMAEILMHLSLLSFYVLGSAWFRKHSFIKTSMALVVLGFNLVLLLNVQWPSVVYTALGYLASPTALVTALVVVCVLVLTFSLWGAYRLMARMQVIEPSLSEKYLKR